MQATSIATFVLVLLSCTTASAVVTSDTLGSHLVRPGESAFGMNLDGVAALAFEGTPNFPLCTGVLISDRHILTVAHAVDRNNDGIPDYFDRLQLNKARFDLPTGTVILDMLPLQVKIPAEWRPNLASDADIAVIPLAADAPPEIPRYALYGGTAEVGQRAVVAGYGFKGFGPAGADFNSGSGVKRGGLNQIEAIGGTFDAKFYDPDPGLTVVYDFDSGQPQNNTLAQLGVASDLGYGGDEVFATFGDSGGPVFINGWVAGITSFGISGYPGDTSPGDNSSWGELGFATRVSAFREFITSATEGQAVFVPEPAACALATVAIALVSALIRLKRVL
jgi:hypothetical protein